MRTGSKDIRALLDSVVQQPGWRVEHRAKAWIVFPPNGTPVSVPHGPRNPYRACLNARAKLRRAGAKI